MSVNTVGCAPLLPLLAGLPHHVAFDIRTLRPWVYEKWFRYDLQVYKQVYCGGKCFYLPTTQHFCQFRVRAKVWAASLLLAIELKANKCQYAVLAKKVFENLFNSSEFKNFIFCNKSMQTLWLLSWANYSGVKIS